MGFLFRWNKLTPSLSCYENKIHDFGEWLSCLLSIFFELHLLYFESAAFHIFSKLGRIFHYVPVLMSRSLPCRKPMLPHSKCDMQERCPVILYTVICFLSYLFYVQTCFLSSAFLYTPLFWQRHFASLPALFLQPV